MEKYQDQGTELIESFSLKPGNMPKLITKYYACCLMLLLSSGTVVFSQQPNQQELDRKVKEFLDQNRSNWRDMNVPYEDGQVLYNLIVKNNYQSALEIGTSTGHSTVWIAWALSKTGGKLITVDIEEQRLEVARENLLQTGLQDFVDVRHADAHELVKTLAGPFDFVFSDADKGWYRQYFIDLDPKLKPGGCFTAHNVRNNMGGIKEFLDYVQGLENYQTTIDKTSRSGISISYKQD
jgi:predicted O-methyltransferase YrrM